MNPYLSSLAYRSVFIIVIKIINQNGWYISKLIVHADIQCKIYMYIPCHGRGLICLGDSKSEAVWSSNFCRATHCVKDEEERTD